MNAMPPQPPQDATDIFSISDQVLADRLQFIEEIGFGNWGSVWACRPKPDPSAPEAQHAAPNSKIAVKLVHRSKTPTTAARVRSLWNEMKVVRELKQEPHPSIIPFHSFIITPSYALITMAFHPRLVPVEVAEHHAKPWFLSLLSGVEFLHARGVVHNDIKPANILLSIENVPVLIDFGFAERYDLSSSDAFHSNLSYGTPEYLSPERARGLPHDTRKSDVWSLGIALFEILVGRTPFEHSEGEQFSTTEDLEKYWARTMKGKWVGSWKMSSGLEKLLRRMISPNADMRCTAPEAMEDPYWTQTHEDVPIPSHKKTASGSQLRPASVVVGGAKHSESLPTLKSCVSKETTQTPRSKAERAKARVVADKENAASPPPLVREKSRSASILGAALPRHKRAQSQSIAQAPEARGVPQSRKHGAIPSVIGTLTPVKHTPPRAAPASMLRTISSPVLKDKENVLQASGNTNSATRTARKPVGPRKPSPPATPPVKRPRRQQDENAHPLPPTPASEKARRRASRVTEDGTANKADSVTARMREWEREKQRIREMERVEERRREMEDEERKEREREEELRRSIERQYALELELEQQRAAETQKKEEAEVQRMKEQDAEMEMEMAQEMERQRELEEEREREREELERRAREVQLPFALPRLSLRKESSPPSNQALAPLSPLIEESESRLCDIEDHVGNDSGLSILRHSLKLSFDMTKRLYKTSTQALARGKSSSSPGRDNDAEPRPSLSSRSSWEEDEELIREAKSSLPALHNIAHDEEMAAANQIDRMTIWIKNVEKVVEDARQNFAAASSTTLPPLPIAPISRRSSSDFRSQRASRVPRRILAANHIFAAEYETAMNDINDKTIEYRRSWMDDTIPTILSEGTTMASQIPNFPTTPRSRRRATIVTRSPEAHLKRPVLEIDISPSKRREKSRSQHDLGRSITPVTRLEFEIEQLSKPAPLPRLSTMVDKNLFIADGGSRSPRCSTFGEPFRVDELTESPQHVEPYPLRSLPKLLVDTLTQKHVEGVYDRFLMSTSGVKRVGRGYQSDNVVPPSQIPQPKTSTRRSTQFFMSTRKQPMPPPVSSDDLRRAASFAEFGTVTGTLAAAKDDNSNSVSIVRRALKAISVKR